MLFNYPSGERVECGEPRRRVDRPVKVSAETTGLLTACVEYSRQSEGAFDISVGPLMKVWGFYKGTGHLPKRDEVVEALGKVGYRNVLLDASIEDGAVREKPAWNSTPAGLARDTPSTAWWMFCGASGIPRPPWSRRAGSGIYALGSAARGAARLEGGDTGSEDETKIDRRK